MVAAATDINSPMYLSVVPEPRSRPLWNNSANSHREIDAIAVPPFDRAFPISRLAERDSFSGFEAIQTRTCVSSRIT